VVPECVGFHVEDMSDLVEPEELHVTESEAPNNSWRPPSSVSQILTSNVFWGLVLALATWPFTAADLSPTPGIDPSWQATLEMAARNGLPWGTHVVFAYGPLGFLSVWSFYYPILAMLSFAFLLGFQSIFFAVLIRKLRTCAPFVVSLVVAYVTGAVAIALVATQFTGGPEKILPLFFIACIGLISRSPELPLSRWMWVALGVALPIFTLIKVSLSATMVVALVITVLCLTSERRHAVEWFAVGAVPTFAVGWFATGNSFTNIFAYAHGSIDIVNGYASALSIEEPGRGNDYWWAALCVVLLGAFAWAHCREITRRVQVGVGLLTLLFTWDLFREGFVRHDTYHDPVFFASVPLLLVAFTPSRRTWAYLVAGVTVATVIALCAVNSFPSPVGRPDLGLRNVGHEVDELVTPSQRTSLLQNAQYAMEAQYQVPPEMLSAIGHQSVVVEPWEQGLVWAYGLTFDPMPAFRDGYTTYLDQLDANYLAGSHAPRFILRQQPVAIDGQDPTFDRPSTQIAIECRYRELSSDTSWQLLEHTSDRCGAMKKLKTVSVGLGQYLSVPRAPGGDAVVATFSLPFSLWWHISNELFKPPLTYATVNGGAVVFRFIPGTASDPHLLVPSRNLGWNADFAPGAITSIAFSVGGQGFGNAGVTATFYEIPMSAHS
jgi:hypothetical protein